jgi:hypothetical protein
LNYERFGICATITILAVVLSVSGIATSVDVGLPTVTFEYQQQSLDEIKQGNISENYKALNDYCEQLSIENCG